jgi:hypothetical protein
VPGRTLRIRRACENRGTAARAPKSSILFATQTVHVTSEAAARPIITAFTMVSACWNMPQGERSCGRDATAMEPSPGCACAKVGKAAHAHTAASMPASVMAVRPAQFSAAPTVLTLALADIFPRPLCTTLAPVTAKMLPAQLPAPERGAMLLFAAYYFPFAAENCITTTRRRICS